jgi:hypothetical protein
MYLQLTKPEAKKWSSTAKGLARGILIKSNSKDFIFLGDRYISFMLM